MGQGYVRNDTANDITDLGVVNAEDLDGEFDALLAAFVAATGHTHDGSAAEGGAVTVVGPAQDFVGGAGDFSPKTDSTHDLGKTAVRWATGYIDDLVLTTALPVAQGGTASTTASAARTALGVVIGTDVQAYTTVLAGTTASYTTAEETKLAGIETAATADQTAAQIKTAYESNAGTNEYSDAEQTKLAGIETYADVTDTSNVTAAGALMDSEVDGDIKTLVLPASTTISTFGASLVDDANAAAGLVTLGLSATAAELNALEGITVTVTELNYTDNVTSPIQTQMDAKAALASPTFTGVPAAPTATAGTDTTQVATTAFSKAVAESIAIGVGQTWQDFTGSRSGSNTSYQNTTGRPIMVSIFKNFSSQWTVSVSTNNSTWVDIGGGASDEQTTVTFIVPAGSYYRASLTSASPNWAELR